MQMPGRKFSAGNLYRYGFQNQETDQELWGGAIFFKYRLEDPRLNRFFSPDPLSPNFPHNSPYAFSENRLIDGIEFEGLEVVLVNNAGLNKIIYSAGMKEKDKKAIHVFAHANPRLIANGKGTSVVRYPDAVSFKKMLDEKSDQWRGKKTGEQTVIVLHACESGKSVVDEFGNEVKPIAMKISEAKEFKDVIVIAPDEEIVFTSEKDKPETAKEVGPRKLQKQPDGSFKIIGMGNWHIFKNGNQIDIKPGDWNPADYPNPAKSTTVSSTKPIGKVADK